uniref:Cytochrome P450 CYP71D2 n=1 Tax=Scutellaria baicalensis TaxID=65409 RepID=A0A286RS90_SCUBA|nr:cytochrome P450 CYP71D2 [Scutellaria baicalensis]
MGFLILLSALAFVFMAVKLLRSKSKTPSPLDQIPGPRKLPLIGDLHLLIGKNPLPHRIFRDLAVKHGPLINLHLGELPWLIVSSVDVAKQVMRTHDIVFANRPPSLVATAISYNYTNLGMASYGEHWRHLKKIATLELLSVKRVRSFRAIREEENFNMAKHIASGAGSMVDLSRRGYLLSFEVTTRATIGKKTDQEQKAITSAITDILKLGSGLSLPDLFPSSKLLPVISGANYNVNRIFRQADTILESIMKQHRAYRAVKSSDERLEDLADVLLQHQEDKDELPLTNETIKGVVMDMFVAGSDTSATGVEWVMSELVKKPSTLIKATEEVRRVMDDKGYIDESRFNELPYLKLVVKEVLRLHPPLPFLVPRISSHESELNGYKIPAETRLIVNAWAIGRDPKYWGDDAEEFKPERFENSTVHYLGNNLEYIPFGSGRRLCPGMNFGVANVEFTAATLLYHFDWSMPKGMKNEDLDMTESFGVTVKRKNPLLLVPTLKRPLKQAPLMVD